MLRTWVSDLGVYFGLRDETYTDRPSTGLALLQRSLLAGALSMLWMALLGTAAVIGLFGWNPATVAVGAAVGIIVWGAGSYRWNVQWRLPHGPLHSAAPDATWEPPMTGLWVRRLVRFVLAAPIIVGLAWLADRLKLGGFFVPGQLAGYAAAYLFGAWHVRRWEQRHHSRVAFRSHGGREELLAVAAPSAHAR